MNNFYIHNTENTLALETLFPATFKYKFFETSEIHNEDLFKSERQLIFCVDDEYVINEINNQYGSILIISSQFMISHLKKYEHIYIENKFDNLLINSVILFSGFEDEDLLKDLKFKVIMMGGCVAYQDLENAVNVTHVIVDKVFEAQLEQIAKLPSCFKNIFNSLWIEVYWINRLSLPDLQKKINNSNLENVFKVKFFQRCRFCLIGFDDKKIDYMLPIIIKNGGSVFQHDRIDSDSIIIIPNDFQAEKFANLLNEIPRDLFGNIVNEEWFLKSVENKYLPKIEQYRVEINGSYGKKLDKELVLSKDNEDYKYNNAFEEKKLEWDSSNIFVLNINNYIEKFDGNINLSYGYNPMGLTKEKIRKIEFKRKQLLRNLANNIKQKLDIFNNFIIIKTNKLMENANFNLIFDVFQQITNFFQGFYDILYPLVENYTEDCCFGLELLLYYDNLKKCFQFYNSKFNQMSEIIDKIDNAAIKDCFNRFLIKNEVSSIRYFMEIPKRMLPILEMQLIEIVNATSLYHPDFFYFTELIQKNKDVTELIETLEDSLIEGQNQLIVMKCIGNPTILQKGNTYRTVVDCMQFYEDGLKSPKSLFFFDKTIVVCKFRLTSGPNKLYEKFLTHFNEQFFEEERKLNKWPSVQSICHYSPHRRGIKRNDSLSSVTTLSSVCVRKLEGNMCCKFHKLFTGLSKLNWNEKPENIYCNTEILEKSRLISITSYKGDFNVSRQMFLTLQYSDVQTGLPKNMKFHLVPRIVKSFSKYNKLKVTLPTHFDWEYINTNPVRWDSFIVEEKQNFCAIIAQHYDIELIEDSLISGSMLSIPSEFDFFNEKSFKTPAKVVDRLLHSTKKVSPSGSFIGSIKKASPKAKSVFTHLRRLTRFHKSSKKNKSPENSVLEDESHLINSQFDDSFSLGTEKHFTETSKFPVSNITNTPIEPISFEPELQNSNFVIQRNIKHSRRKCKSNSNSFSFIDESPKSLETTKNNNNNNNNHESFIPIIIDKNESQDINDSLEFSNVGQPNNSLNPVNNVQQRKFTKRKSGTGPNIKNKNRKY